MTMRKPRKKKRSWREPSANARRKTQLRLWPHEQEQLEAAAKRAPYAADPKRGYTSWLRQLGLLVAKGRYPNAVGDWLAGHGLVKARKAA